VPPGPRGRRFRRKGIHPHVPGRLSKTVLAVMRHPAMLLYLGNAGSFGPDRLSAAAHRGLNEARRAKPGGRAPLT
jgi:uncharacterized protein (DUF1800 family)